MKDTRGPDLAKVFTALALLASVSMIGALWRYQQTPGAAPPSPSQWPEGSALQLSATLPTLVLFAHPQCACTEATLTELSELLEHARGRVDARVVFSLPEGVDESWRHTSLWRRAEEIPGVSVVADPGQKETQRFATMTSGQLLLYNPEGRLLFAGGITAARGHTGENTGRSAVESILAGAASAAGALPGAHPVYGCALKSPAGGAE